LKDLYWSFQELKQRVSSDVVDATMSYKR
jgi:hypothetical protein